MVKSRIFAGKKLKELRTARGLKQHEMAELLAISASYLSQLEHDDRPLTGPVLSVLARDFSTEWDEYGSDDAERRVAQLQEAAMDPLFSQHLQIDQLIKASEQQPLLSEQFIELHSAYREVQERLQMSDEKLFNENGSEARLPWEEVRDWFHTAGNYIDELDVAAEHFASDIAKAKQSPTSSQIEEHLRLEFGISTEYRSIDGLREYDHISKKLVLGTSQSIESQRFQLAHQLAALKFKKEIAKVVDSASLRTDSAHQLLFVGLANYAAGALLMPYLSFRKKARELRHDIDRLCQQFHVSFEQACHRLSNLQRPNAKGIPVFFCRVDMAGNITKRHSATRLQFARFGGACPLWNVHEAAAIPDRILVQLSETPDGVRYISISKGLVKPSGNYNRSPRRYAIALGCEVEHAHAFVYADDAPSTPTPIGVTCRMCTRLDCDQRAFPPNDRAINISTQKRDVVPYQIVAASLT